MCPGARLRAPEATKTCLGLLPYSQFPFEPCVPVYVSMSAATLLPHFPHTQAKAAIQSPAFIRAAYSVHASHVPLLRGMPPLSLQQVAARLRSAASRLTFVPELHTRVALPPSGAAAPPSAATAAAAAGAGSRVYEFSCARTGRLYLAVPPPGLPASWLLAQALSRELGSPAVTLPLQPFLERALGSAAPAGDDGGDGAAATGVGEEDLLQPLLLPGGYDPALERAGQAGQVGAPLLESDRRLLQLRPLKRYCAGDLVAVRRSDLAAAAAEAGITGAGAPAAAAQDAASAAAAAALARATAGDGTGAAGTAGATAGATAVPAEDMVYARVAAACGPQGDETLHWVLLDAGTGRGDTLRLLSSQVFSFRSNAGGGPGDEAGPQGPQQLQQPQQQDAGGARQPGASGGSSSSGGPTAPSSSTTGNTAAAAGAQQPDATAATAATAAPRVGSQQLVSAVKDLLSAAGLPLDLEREQLLQQATTLREALASAQRGLSQAQAQAASEHAEAEAVRQEWQCKVRGGVWRDGASCVWIPK